MLKPSASSLFHTDLLAGKPRSRGSCVRPPCRPSGSPRSSGGIPRGTLRGPAPAEAPWPEGIPRGVLSGPPDPPPHAPLSDPPPSCRTPQSDYPGACPTDDEESNAVLDSDMKNAPLRACEAAPAFKACLSSLTTTPAGGRLAESGASHLLPYAERSALRPRPVVVFS